MKKMGTPPKWWSSVVSDITKLIIMEQELYTTPGIILEAKYRDSDTELEYPIGYLIRMDDGRVGFYNTKRSSPKLKVGSKISDKLPKPTSLVDEPQLKFFIFRTLISSLALMPRLWLIKIIDKILKNEPITFDEDHIPFNLWVMIPLDKRNDKELIDLLYKAVSYEGVKGLYRFNDIITLDD